MRSTIFSFTLVMAFLLTVGSAPSAHGHALVDNPAGAFELPWANQQVKRSFATDM